MEPVVAVPLSFLIGGIPFGWLAVRILKGQDVRTLGSGNIGATNASRCFPGAQRWIAFFAIYALDFAKGLGPVLLWTPAGSAWLGPLLGLAAVAGHCFTPYLGFRGGKGVATACGVLAALDPIALVVALLVFALVLSWTRVVALGSIALGFALALTVVLRDPATAFGERWSISALSIFLALFIVWTHRSNLRRMLAERRAGRSTLG